MFSLYWKYSIDKLYIFDTGTGININKSDSFFSWIYSYSATVYTVPWSWMLKIQTGEMVRPSEDEAGGREGKGTGTVIWITTHLSVRERGGWLILMQIFSDVLIGTTVNTENILNIHKLGISLSRSGIYFIYVNNWFCKEESNITIILEIHDADLIHLLVSNPHPLELLRVRDQHRDGLWGGGVWQTSIQILSSSPVITRIKYQYNLAMHDIRLSNKHREQDPPTIKRKDSS